MARKVAWIVSILLLLNTGVLGLYNGVSELSLEKTPFQQSVTGGVLVYGVLGLLGTVALFLRHRSAVNVTTAWALVVTYVASTAALAYGGPDVSIGAALAAGLGAALIGLFVVWTARLVTRPDDVIRP